MDIGSLLLILALALFVAAFLARPLVQHQGTVVTEEEHHVSELMAERDRVLAALAELDFDHGLGKVPDDLYNQQRAALVARGTAALRQLDQEGVAVEMEAIDQHSDQQASLDEEDDAEALIAARRAARSGKKQPSPASGGFCPNCGEAVKTDDKFCTNCGQGLS